MIETDASTNVWKAHCCGVSAGVTCSSEGQVFHIKVLELQAAKIAIFTFMKGKSATTIFKWTTDCPFISSEDGGNSQQATAAYKQIMIMIMITEEYLPSRLGISPCREQFRMETFARGITGNRENFGQLTTDLFASRLSHQLRQYVTWKPDPSSIGTNTMQQN